MDATRERTHRFSKNQPIDCENWLEFTIVEETMRYHTIRYRSKVDKVEPKAVESTRTEPKAL